MAFWDKEPKLKCRIARADGIEERKLILGDLRLIDDEDGKAWEIDPNQQARGGKRGELTQFLSEYNKRPIQVFWNRPRAKSQATEIIARQEFSRAAMEVEKKDKKVTLMNWLLGLDFALLLLLTIVILIRMLT